MILLCLVRLRGLTDEDQRRHADLSAANTYGGATTITAAC